MTRVIFGNAAPVHLGPKTDEHPDGEPVGRTVTVIPDVHLGTLPLMEVLRNLTDPQGIVDAHTTEPPVWIESDDETLHMVLQRHYGVGNCPDDWADIAPDLFAAETPLEEEET